MNHHVLSGIDLSNIPIFEPKISNIIQPKRPIQGSRWEYLQPYTANPRFEGHYWVHPDGYLVISSMEVADGILTDEIIPQYHLSISRYKVGKPPKRCSSADANFILKQFDLEFALEDNHVPYGTVRNFWQPVNENLVGKECECTETENKIIEDKGDYIWRPAEH